MDTRLLFLVILLISGLYYYSYRCSFLPHREGYTWLRVPLISRSQPSPPLQLNLIVDESIQKCYNECHSVRIDGNCE